MADPAELGLGYPGVFPQGEPLTCASPQAERPFARRPRWARPAGRREPVFSQPTVELRPCEPEEACAGCGSGERRPVPSRGVDVTQAVRPGERRGLGAGLGAIHRLMSGVEVGRAPGGVTLVRARKRAR